MGFSSIPSFEWRAIFRCVCGGVALCTCLLFGGCATRTVAEVDSEHPELRLTAGGVYMGETSVPVREIVETLEDADIPKDRTIHILLDRDMKDLRGARALMALLAQGGYTQSVLVTREHGVSRTKSGETYAEAAGLERRSDIDFFVTEEGVSFGLMTRVATTDDVLRCLEENKVGRGQLIRLNYRKDREGKMSPDMKRNLDLLESCLREAGYANVCRMDVYKRLKRKSADPPARISGVDRFNAVAPVLGTELAPSTLGTSSSSSSVIRYKKASE